MNWCNYYKWRGHKYINRECKCGENNKPLHELSVSERKLRLNQSFIDILAPKIKHTNYITPAIGIITTIVIGNQLVKHIINITNNTTAVVNNSYILPIWIVFIILPAIAIYFLTRWLYKYE